MEKTSVFGSVNQETFILNKLYDHHLVQRIKELNK